MKGIVNFLISNSIIGFAWSTMQIYCEMTDNSYLYIFSALSIKSVPIFPPAAFTYCIASFVKKTIWKYNWHKMTLHQQKSYCREHRNPCCDSPSSGK